MHGKTVPLDPEEVMREACSLFRADPSRCFSRTIKSIHGEKEG